MPPELLQLLQTLLSGGSARQPQQPQTNILDILRATDPDPVGTNNRLAGLPSYAPGSQSPFATGFFNPENRATSLTPEARLASQGNNAMNQWAQLGGVSGVDPSALATMNAAKARPHATPPRTDFGPVPAPPIPPEPATPQVGSWMGGPQTGWELIGPKGPGSGGGFLLDSVPGVPPPKPNETPFGIVNPTVRRKPKAGRGGTSFGASGNPRPGFSY